MLHIGGVYIYIYIYISYSCHACMYRILTSYASKIKKFDISSTRDVEQDMHIYIYIYIYIHITSCIYPTLVEDMSNLFDTQSHVKDDFWLSKKFDISSTRDVEQDMRTIYPTLVEDMIYHMYISHIART